MQHGLHLNAHQGQMVKKQDHAQIHSAVSE